MQRTLIDAESNYIPKPVCLWLAPRPMSFEAPASPPAHRQPRGGGDYSTCGADWRKWYLPMRQICHTETCTLCSGQPSDSACGVLGGTWYSPLPGSVLYAGATHRPHPPPAIIAENSIRDTLSIVITHPNNRFKIHASIWELRSVFDDASSTDGRLTVSAANHATNTVQDKASASTARPSPCFEIPLLVRRTVHHFGLNSPTVRRAHKTTTILVSHLSDGMIWLDKRDEPRGQVAPSVGGAQGPIRNAQFPCPSLG